MIRTKPSGFAGELAEDGLAQPAQLGLLAVEKQRLRRVDRDRDVALLDVLLRRGGRQAHLDAARDVEDRAHHEEDDQQEGDVGHRGRRDRLVVVAEAVLKFQDSPRRSCRAAWRAARPAPRVRRARRGT